MAELESVEPLPAVTGLPQWINPLLDRRAGRDPLGLQTITTDRIMPGLVPGVLALSRRARYLSFYPFLLLEFQEQRLQPDNERLSDFIKAREYEYALAIQLCPRCASTPSGAVGKERAAPAARQAGNALARGHSVESWLGGYGLYYRTPLTQLGIVAPAGSLIGEEPIPVDVLMRDEPRAKELALAFRKAVGATAYYREHMRGVSPTVPTEVLREFSLRACLCRLDESPGEQEAIRRALSSPPLNAGQTAQAEARQRRRSFALFLSVLDASPAVADLRAGGADAAFRRTIWTAFEETRARRTVQAETTAQWSALVAKEYMQDGLATPEAVNLFETPRGGNYRSGGTSCGGLIHAGPGSGGGTGTWRTNRSGCAA